MKVSTQTLKWAMRFYPPLFFQRIWVQRFHHNFRGVDVKIGFSLLNKNYNASIFGGTIFAASDPFYAILFDQIFKRKGYKTLIWLKSASINYIKPGRTALYFQIRLSEEDIQAAQNILDQEGKYIKTFPIEIKDKNGEICALVANEIYIRNLQKQELEKPG